MEPRVIATDYPATIGTVTPLEDLETLIVFVEVFIVQSIG